MNDVQPEVLLVTARVQAAIEVATRIVGPQVAWATWMRDGLEEEQAKAGRASSSSPHPKLLGSLNRMLLQHYTTGMALETLEFDQVRSNDRGITGDSYVDVPLEALPQQLGDNLWWKVLPPSVALKKPPPPGLESVRHLNNLPTVSVHTNAENVTADIPCPSSRRSSIPVIGTPGTPGTPGTSPKDSAPPEASQRQKRSATHDGPPRPPKKRKGFKSRPIIESDDDDDDSEPGPSARRDKDKGVVVTIAETKTSESPKVCDACRSRNRPCVWPTGAESSTSWSEKRACNACASQKVKCEINGVFSIRPPRRKRETKAQSSVPPQTCDEHTRLIDQMIKRISDLEKDNHQMSKRISDLEKDKAAQSEHDRRMAARIVALELRENQSKGEAPNSSG